MPGPSCPLTVTRNGDGRVGHGADVFLGDPAGALHPALDDPRRHAGDDATVRDFAAHDGPAATTTCSPICAPGRMTALAPSQLPEPMRTGASVGHCRPIGSTGSS